MNVFDKLVKIVAFKRLDIIEREQAKWFVEFDTEKICQSINILRKRKERIQKHPKMPRETRQSLVEIIDDVILMGTLLSGCHMLKNKEVEKMTLKQVEEINKEQTDIDEFAGQENNGE